MKICVNCRIEMVCTHTGRTAVWHGNHVYRGDEHTCPSCGAKFLNCSATPYYDPDALSKTRENPLNMTEDK